MRVRECMSHRIESVDANDTVQAAAERMRALDVGSLPVFALGRLIGMITDRDLVVRALARGCGPSTPVRGVMTPDVVTCLADDDVAEAAATMARHAVRRLVVLDRGLQAVGMLSVDDLALQGCAPEILASVFARG
jgi:CBS domain-containing protein